MAEIPEWRKKVERRGEERRRERERKKEKAEERGEERKDPATVRYFLIDVDIWKTLRRTSMHRDNAMCLAYLEGASCIARFIASSFSTSSSILTLESARDPTIPCIRPRWTNISIKTSCATIRNELEINATANRSKIVVATRRSFSSFFATSQRSEKFEYFSSLSSRRGTIENECERVPSNWKNWVNFTLDRRNNYSEKKCTIEKFSGIDKSETKFRGNEY